MQRNRQRATTTAEKSWNADVDNFGIDNTKYH